MPREQLAVLLLRALAVPGFVPPAATGIFLDVPSNDPFAPWIEELFRRGITTGCPPSPSAFCPDDATTRGQAAGFLVRAFGFGF